MATLTATPSTSGRPKVTLQVADLVEASPSLVRVDPDGHARPVRMPPDGLVPVGGTWAGADYEAPLDVIVRYQLRSGATVLVEASVTVTSDKPWLIHPGIPALSHPVRIIKQEDTAWVARTAPLDVIGRASPMVVTGLRATRSGTLVLAVTAGPERTALLQLIADGSVLLLRVPCKPMFDDGDYLAVLDVTEEPNLGGGEVPSMNRRWSIEYRICAMPLGPRQPERTWQQVLDEGTWQQVLDNHGTWAGVLMSDPATQARDHIWGG